MADNRSHNQIERDHEVGHPRATMYRMVPITEGNYEVMLLICTQCPYIQSTYCMHIKNSWNKEGTVLTCDLCGIDGT